MSSTLDVKMNFNAIPEYARTVAAEHAGPMYRDLTDSERAREENLRRSRQVPETNSRENPARSRAIDLHQAPLTERIHRNANDRSGRIKNEKLPFDTYSGNIGDRSAFRRARMEENSGFQVDFTV